ncbi:metal dependent phosphohydrolase [Thermincola ferriacetica]|uniref:Metal dependent phosphohydrolase n=2 Tax=Thermincola TaxID=278993 RepID=D5XCM1_THEPJ|nr:MULTISPECIES: HD domain-containing protein [Thermincola]ADG81647.1 metal dependent phosphohydrolase [Thermincola potens JR]KNZ69012.1 metal dependent phosphohydrolase [Thermincola ferriacetica]
MITLENIKNHPEIDTYFQKTNMYLGKMGAIEHNYQHAETVARNSAKILKALGYPKRQQELAGIAGYLHDVGNVINRYDHGRTGGVLAFTFLFKMGMPPEEIAVVVSAIGNHEERNGSPVSPVGAAVMIADKADVHRSRVRKTDFATFTTRDRVNYAVDLSELKVDGVNRKIIMDLSIDLEICSVMEYFEIFLTRMLLCRRAASLLNCEFELFINKARLL